MENEWYAVYNLELPSPQPEAFNPEEGELGAIPIHFRCASSFFLLIFFGFLSGVMKLTHAYATIITSSSEVDLALEMARSLLLLKASYSLVALVCQVRV